MITVIYSVTRANDLTRLGYKTKLGR